MVGQRKWAHRARPPPAAASGRSCPSRLQRSAQIGYARRWLQHMRHDGVAERATRPRRAAACSPAISGQLLCSRRQRCWRTPSHLSSSSVTRRPPPQRLPHLPWTGKRVLPRRTHTQTACPLQACAAPIVVHTQAGSSQPKYPLGPITRLSQQYRAFGLPELAVVGPIQARATGGLADDRVSWRAPQNSDVLAADQPAGRCCAPQSNAQWCLAPFKTAGSVQVAGDCFPMVAAAQGTAAAQHRS